MSVQSQGEFTVNWPAGSSPLVSAIKPAPEGDKVLARARIRADARCLHIGNNSLPVGGFTIKIDPKRPVILKTEALVLELSVPSWIQGSFDSDLTVALGRFCQAVANGDLKRMQAIASSMRMLRVLEISIFGGGFLVMSTTMCFAVFSQWPTWMLVIVPLGIMIACFNLREQKRRKTLKRLDIKGVRASDSRK